MKAIRNLYLEYGTNVCLILVLFVIPISPTLKSIFLPLALISILATPKYQQQLRWAYSQTWAIACLSFFTIVVLGCFWGVGALTLKWVYLEKYSKVLFIPLLALGFQNNQTRKLGVYSYLLAMLLACVLSLVNLSDPPGAAFHNRIVTSNMIAFATFLSILVVLKSHGLQRWLASLLVFLFSYQIFFINTGRTGMILYIGFILLLLLFLPARFFFLGLLGISIGLITLFWVSTTFHQAIMNVVHDWQLYQQNFTQTHLGDRLRFHHLAMQLFLAKPLLGQGVGGFATVFEASNTDPTWRHLLDPHSQYWLIAADLGFLGLIALGFLIISLWQAAQKLVETKMILIGTLLMFLVSNLSDSQLLYSAMGNLFIVLFALCLGEGLELRNRTTST